MAISLASVTVFANCLLARTLLSGKVAKKQFECMTSLFITSAPLKTVADDDVLGGYDELLPGIECLLLHVGQKLRI